MGRFRAFMDILNPFSCSKILPIVEFSFLDGWQYITCLRYKTYFVLGFDRLNKALGAPRRAWEQ